MARCDQEGGVTHTHTHSLSLLTHVLPQHQEERPWETTEALSGGGRPCPGCKRRVAARNQQPASGVPSPGNTQQGPRLAGVLSVPRRGWLGPWHSDHSAKRWTGFNLLLPAVPGLREPDASPPARPGKGRGPSAPGSQQITLLGLELPPAVLASLAGALQRGHGLRRGDSPTRAPAQPLPPLPPRQRC